MTKAKQKWDKYVEGQEALGRKRRPSLFLTDEENETIKAFLREFRKRADKLSEREG